jgi:molybdopterin-containing oxidoreductase family iron-sulfur binding subunit
MDQDRRRFLKWAGGAVAAVAAAKTVGKAVAQTAHEAPVVPREEGIAGKKWGMAIDLRKCPEGCRKCADACHAVHNVPDFGNPKDEVKWIWMEEFERTFPEQDHVYLPEATRHRKAVVLCNHCENPPCVRACPTEATFKRGDGVVMMDFHRCIGCRFCVSACPYGARSLNFRDPRPFLKASNPDFPTRMRGVVEKCNYCEERLAKGEAPACALACPEKCIAFGDLNDWSSPVRAALRENFSLQRKPALGTRPTVFYFV